MRDVWLFLWFEHLEGIAGLLIDLNNSIAVESQGIGRLEERGRDRETAGQWSTQSPGHLSIKFSVLCGASLWHLKTITVVTSMITPIDHHNKCNKNEKILNIARITRRWQTFKMSKCCWKMEPVDLPDTELPQTFNVYKAQYLLNMIKGNLIKQGVPVVYILVKRDIFRDIKLPKFWFALLRWPSWQKGLRLGPRNLFRRYRNRWWSRSGLFADFCSILLLGFFPGILGGSPGGLGKSSLW